MQNTERRDGHRRENRSPWFQGEPDGLSPFSVSFLFSRGIFLFLLCIEANFPGFRAFPVIASGPLG